MDGASTPIEPGLSPRDLMQRMRTGLDTRSGVLPESIALHIFLELRRHHEPTAARQFISALRALHQRRALGIAALCSDDRYVDEHRLLDDPILADLWKAYKRCITGRRPAHALELLRDIEARLCPM